MKYYKAIFREKDGYDKLTVYKDEKGNLGKKIAEVSEQTNGISRREKIDLLLLSLLTSMREDASIAKIFSNVEFNILYEDHLTKETTLYKTRREKLIRGFGSFKTTLF